MIPPAGRPIVSDCQTPGSCARLSWRRGARVLQSTSEITARRWAGVAVLLAIVQIGAGLLNLVLLAPVWMQILHLLLADATWIALVLLAARALALAPPVESAEPVAA